MKESIIRSLPDALQIEGQLTPLGQALALLGWLVVFMAVGLIVGMFIYRRFHRAVSELQKDNRKGHDRVAIYRATIEKQEISHDRIS